jgi:hypothetical protein
VSKQAQPSISLSCSTRSIALLYGHDTQKRPPLSSHVRSGAAGASYLTRSGSTRRTPAHDRFDASVVPASAPSLLSRDEEAQCASAAMWRDMLPELGVLLLPLLGGVVALILDFRLWVLGLMVLLLVLGTLGNALVRGSLACSHCPQRELGCPALALFEPKPRA